MTNKSVDTIKPSMLLVKDRHRQTEAKKGQLTLANLSGL